MIVAEQKPIRELCEMIGDRSRILIIGCKGCVTVCNAGGAKETAMTASALRIWARKTNREMHVAEHTLERQCDPEYIEEVGGMIDDYDAVISLACGVGPQFLSERYPSSRVFPGVNTKFMGGAVEHGIWSERCAGCGTCVVHLFGGICPVARCSKSLLNGPCGGSNRGKCEISNDVDCVWDIIVTRMMAQDRLEELVELRLPKSWATARDGGPRTTIREELVL